MGLSEIMGGFAVGLRAWRGQHRSLVVVAWVRAALALWDDSGWPRVAAAVVAVAAPPPPAA